MFETGSVFILIRKYVTNNSLRKKKCILSNEKKKNLPGELERIDNNILYGENYFSYHLHLKFSLLVITRRQQGTIMFKEKTKQKKKRKKKN